MIVSGAPKPWMTPSTLEHIVFAVYIILRVFSELVFDQIPLQALLADAPRLVHLLVTKNRRLIKTRLKNTGIRRGFCIFIGHENARCTGEGWNTKTNHWTGDSDQDVLE